MPRLAPLFCVGQSCGDLVKVALDLTTALNQALLIAKFPHE